MSKDVPIIEGCMPRWIVANIQGGVAWRDVPVTPLKDASDEDVSVLIVPVGRNSVADASAKIRKALEG